MRKYGKIQALKRVGKMVGREVVVQEKVDGSQCVFGLDNDGKLRIESRRGSSPSPTDRNFGMAIRHLSERIDLLIPGVTYYAESVSRPKHVTLCYDGIPKGGLVLFDIYAKGKYFRTRVGLETIASDLEIDVVPELYRGPFETMPKIEELMDRESFLGGAQMEGIVIKDYQSGLRAKIVGEKFQETRGRSRVRKVVSDEQYFHDVFESYKTEARWRKAVQHLDEEGKLAGERNDIGPIIKEIISDFSNECSDEVMGILWERLEKRVHKVITDGFSQWYIKELEGD